MRLVMSERAEQMHRILDMILFLQERGEIISIERRPWSTVVYRFNEDISGCDALRASDDSADINNIEMALATEVNAYEYLYEL